MQYRSTTRVSSTVQTSVSPVTSSPMCSPIILYSIRTAKLHMWAKLFCALLLPSQKLQLYAFRRHIDPATIEEKPSFHRIFTMTRPMIPMDFENICNCINAVFVIQLRSSIRPPPVAGATPSQMPSRQGSQRSLLRCERLLLEGAATERRKNTGRMGTATMKAAAV